MVLNCNYLNFIKKLPDMKRLIYLGITMLMLIPQSIFAQGQGQVPGQEAERLASYKIAIFTRRLNLTPTEAEKFWPLYNDYDKKRLMLQKERSELMRQVNLNEANMSNDELAKAGDRLVSMEVEEALLTETLHKKLKEFLPPGKVIRVYQAENQFRNQLLNELKGTREIRKNNLQ